MIFKVGDKVIKARPFSDVKYCKYGGDDSQVKIGEVGTVARVGSVGSVVNVSFKNYKWDVHPSELTLAEGKLDKLKKRLIG